ncbi:MAG: S8 family serine peptidase [Chloroflexota bacterium]|nr:S8 family serine peptidase [Chloroflexota bacterium]
MAIRKLNCPDEPDWIQLEAWDIPALEFYSPGHHIGNPEESRNPGMLAVGAAHWGSPQAIASYSSHGPTIDGRIKPDITGIACGQTALRYSRSWDGTECWFSGTSQAAPHVAGLAALVRQRFPNYTPAQVAEYLKKHADDHERGPLGADNTWGHGLAVLPPGPEPTRRGSPPITDFDVHPGENPDEVIISWDPVPEATNYRIGYVNLEVDYHLATQASCTMERDDWLQAFVYVDVKAPNVPVRNGRAEWTIRRLSPGARHAFTVLTSSNLYNNSLNVGAEFTWPKVGPQELRWVRVDGRSDLPPGVAIPQLDCSP